MNDILQEKKKIAQKNRNKILKHYVVIGSTIWKHFEKNNKLPYLLKFLEPRVKEGDRKWLSLTNIGLDANNKVHEYSDS